VSKKSILIETEYIKLKKLLREVKKELYLQLIMEGVDDPGILKCVFMAGGPGSGKSFTAMELFGVDKTFKNSFAASGLKVVNSDSAFEKLLKDNGINPKDLGTIEKEDPELWDSIANSPTGVRSQAKSITKKQKEFYEAGRLGMIIDGTGDDYKKIAVQKKHAESLGYDCYMVFVNTSLEVALERNQSRDRTLSDDLVQTIWKDVQQNMGKFQGLFGSSNFTIVDNTVYGPPPGNVKKAIDKFVRQYTQNPIGKKWIETARMLKNKNIIK
jgi:predicted kinase